MTSAIMTIAELAALCVLLACLNAFLIGALVFGILDPTVAARLRRWLAIFREWRSRSFVNRRKGYQ